MLSNVSCNPVTFYLGLVLVLYGLALSPDLLPAFQRGGLILRRRLGRLVLVGAAMLVTLWRALAPRVRPAVPLVARGVALMLVMLASSPFGAELLASDQGPWKNVGDALCDLFFNTLGKALAIVAVVIGGLMYAFGEGGSKSQIAGLAFGAGMVLMAPGFLRWLLPDGGLGKGCPT